MHPLQRLLLSNRGRGLFRAEASPGAEEATVYLYDVIVSDEMTAEWWGGVAPQSFVKQLLAIDAPTIHMRINCPGGDVFAGRAIEQAIREHGSRIVAHVDGYAASAASYVALAADEVVMAPGAFFMIHKAWSVCYGNADDLLALASLLEKVDGTLADTYVRETGQPRDQIAEWMAAETWFTADEALRFGFADRIAEDAARPAAAASFDLSAYAGAPKAAPSARAADTEHLRRRLRLAERQAA